MLCIYDIEKRSAILENASGFARLDSYIRSCNKMAALGYVYTLGKQTLRSPECCCESECQERWIPRGSDNFAFPQMLYESECHEHWIPRGSDISACPHVWLGSEGVQCQALEARKNLVGRILIRIWKSENGVIATTTLFPHANSRLYLGTLSHLAPWNKPIHGLELFATVSPVLPTCANTLDRSCHF